MHTLARCPWDLKLAEETPQLLSDSHRPQQALIVEKVFMTPLGALLMLQERKNIRLHNLDQNQVQRLQVFTIITKYMHKHVTLMNAS